MTNKEIQFKSIQFHLISLTLVKVYEISLSSHGNKGCLLNTELPMMLVHKLQIQIKAAKYFFHHTSYILGIFISKMQDTLMYDCAKSIWGKNWLADRKIKPNNWWAKSRCDKLRKYESCHKQIDEIQRPVSLVLTWHES